MKHKGLFNDFVRFSFVGALGFAINFLVLYILYKRFGWPVFISQLIGSEVALFNNFVFHHHWTYKDHGTVKALKRLIIEFHVSSWVAILGSAILVSFLINILSFSFVSSLFIASLIAALWNFGWTRFYIWKRHSDA